MYDRTYKANPCLKIEEHKCNNNNQAFYSQASWGRLEMKHEQKKDTKQEQKRRKKQRTIKKPNKKGEKIIKR
jgi:hypothetical protein